jgi:hypothetical protein
VQGQQRPLPVIGYLSRTNADTEPRIAAAFLQGVGEHGYVEGQNVEEVGFLSSTTKQNAGHSPPLSARRARSASTICLNPGISVSPPFRSNFSNVAEVIVSARCGSPC